MTPLDLLVINQYDQTACLLDTTTGVAVATIPIPEFTGHEVAVTPGGDTAFVPIYGDSGVGLPGTDGSSIVVVDLPSRRVRDTIRFAHGVRPHHPVYDPRRNLLYITAELDRSVAILDPGSLALVASIPTSQEESHMLALSRDGRRAYTANVRPGTVSVLDLEARRTLAVIPVAPRIQRISISIDDGLVFTADQTSPRLAVISTASHEVTRFIPLPGIGYGSVATSDGRYLLVTLWQTNLLAVVDLEQLAVVSTITVDPGPVQILLHPGGQTAWVASPSEGTVCEIGLAGDPSGWTRIRSITAGAGADGLAWVRR